jgi:hypothetical protein
MSQLGENIATARSREAAQSAEKTAQHLELAAAAVDLVTSMIAGSRTPSTLYNELGERTGREITAFDLADAGKTARSKAEQEKAISTGLQQDAQSIQERGLPS